MKLKKKHVILAALVLALITGGLLFYFNFSPAVRVGYTEITRADLVSSIRVNGIAESALKRNVISNLDFKVKTVSVEEGDTVEAGQILCKLDTDELELNIAQQKAELLSLRESTSVQLQDSRRLYEEAAENLANNTNQQILNAEAALTAANNNLNNARKTYNNAQNDYENKTGAAYLSAEASLINAQKNYDDALADYTDKTGASYVNAKANLDGTEISLGVARNDFESGEVLYEAGIISKYELDLYETALTNAENAYNTALKAFNDVETANRRNLELAENAVNSATLNFDNAELSLLRQFEQAELALTSAQRNYDDASRALDAAKISAEQNLSQYLSNVEGAEIATDLEAKEIAIQLLEKKLADSTVTAPVSGSVTSVFAKEGSVGSGLLFVIEDTEDLKIITEIDEFDIGQVKPGAEALIELDAAVYEEYSGVVTKISQAAVKDTAGETVPGSVVEFEAEVEVRSENTALKIGMNVDVIIMLDRKENVFSVPLKAVALNENNESVIYEVNSVTGKNRAREIPVITGAKNDTYIEVFNYQLMNGMKIINDASLVTDGTEVEF